MKLDAIMTGSDWAPRLIPFVFYVAMLMVIDAGVSYGGLWLYPFLYVLQCGLVVWLLWRYRKQIPEMNWKFHWLAVPTGLGLTWAWVELGDYMTGLGSWFDFTKLQVEHPFAKMKMQMDEGGRDWLVGLYYSSIVLRLVGMSVVVPMFEELFTRSLCLRALHSPKSTWLGLKQLAHDMPMIGDRYMLTESGKQAALQPPAFTEEFKRTALGDVSAFAILATTVVFMLSHVMRDWPGCIACGVVWCLLIAMTNRKGKKQYGLGPVIWSHGITNAALWWYVIETGRWEYL
ncbi:CAAX amino terminal protease self- immunity [Poriferisphaera corsica]|uniref:CAAX amino terminal protease self-immunity n=1 Tax=Poriferisphaera corsica TaxID=2528020 RepID=A0A517YZE8_9BACT|nr:CPBP family glutamic-type intramembrane protease [Poriferisphaera corsica]QDU35579.1 CAAX amino terminal protease self- immunity [Poriferisphaera corsica]